MAGTIDWFCQKCRVRNSSAEIPGATIAAISDRADRKHEELSPDCWLDHGIAHIRVQRNGLRYALTEKRTRRQREQRFWHHHHTPQHPAPSPADDSSTATPTHEALMDPNTSQSQGGNLERDSKVGASAGIGTATGAATGEKMVNAIPGKEVTQGEPILRYFETFLTTHNVPADLRPTVEWFVKGARQIDANVPRSAEKATGLRHLLDALECTFRAYTGAM